MTTAHILARGHGHQPIWGASFAAGLRRHGWRVTLGDQQRPCDLLVLWGVRNRQAIASQKSRGSEVCILERGYVDDRFAWTSVSFGGGLNGRGEFRGPFTDPSRWNTHFSGLLRPWKSPSEGRGLALVMGQVAADQAVRHVDIEQFYRDAAAAFEGQGFKVRVRPHPHGRPASGPTLEADLAGAVVAVTFNSNSGVDAVLAGVPTVAMDPGSMAWDVAGHALKMPPMPDRTAWAHALAWKQWSLGEIESGYCWEMIGRGE